ncbi:MAG: transcription termination/antitermination factor NusG [Planctomycetes bacterium]|nr:transcription termination/antitermination factor NusG [Planctomycetota bacterium]
MSKGWYVLRVQSNREEIVKRALDERIRQKGIDHIVSRVLVPAERVGEIKGGEKRVVERKIYPGYIMVEMDVAAESWDEVWYLIKETPGIGDFVGAPGPGSKPHPMDANEVDRVLRLVERKEDEPRLKIEFGHGDQVKIKEGTFENFNGVVEDVDGDKGLVKVTVTIFGRATPIELEYWKIERV